MSEDSIHRGHHHSHSHTKEGTVGRLGLAFGLNLSFAIIELFGGYWTNSVAILTDALHDFGDSFAIALAIIFERLSQQAANDKYSYGYRRFSAAAALVTGFILVGGSVVILSEAIPRLFAPQTPHAPGMIAIAILGLSVNGFAAWKMSRGASLNERMIVWHLMEDVFGWVAVLVGAVVIYMTGWAQIDAILACLIAIWILYNVTRNLREVLGVFLQMVPLGVSLSSIESKIRSVTSVSDIHHLHVWSLDGEHHILTAHIVVGKDNTSSENESLKIKIKEILRNEGIFEATLEFEHLDSDCVDPSHKV